MESAVFLLSEKLLNGVAEVQVHLSPAGVNAMTVAWATQNYTVGLAVTALKLASTG